MCVLGSQAIRERLGEIFVRGTAVAENATEASYELRLASDGLLFGGRWYGIGQPVSGDVTIGRGEVVVLSTIECFRMPADLVGNVNIKFRQALKGLILLFGSRVDPKYGWDLRTEIARTDPYDGQRLYLLVCNVGSQDVTLRPEDPVWMVEFHTVGGDVVTPPRPNNDTRIANQFSAISKSGFGFLFGMDERVVAIEKDIQLQRPFTRTVIFGFFGVLLVTLIGVVLSFFLNLGPMFRAQGSREAVRAVRSDGDLSIAGVVTAVEANRLLIRPVLVEHRWSRGMLLSLLRVGPAGEMEYVATVRIAEVGSDRIVAGVLSRAAIPRVGDIVGPAFGKLR